MESSSLPRPPSRPSQQPVVRHPIPVLPYPGAYKFGTWESVEDREEYRPGGFHPVLLGSRVGENDEYRIIHKLGYGGFATVWLARDSVADRYVALKIMKAEVSDVQVSKELVNIEKLRAAPPEQSGRQYVAMPLVLPVLGPRVTAKRVLETFDGQAKRNMARQAAEGLRFLHANGVGHGDFKPSNILLKLADLDDWTEEEVMERLGEPETDLIETSSGEPLGPAAPPYVVLPLETADLDPRFLQDQIMIIDFGESFDEKSPPEGLGTPIGYCSPELLFDD
ncbi:MAG: hypothetical protein M4579_000837 [Chaenotheca gracillima]|nr:MAG: hypothetical protein M4579_000837 [Chaenotheca gracillima]